MFRFLILFILSVIFYSVRAQQVDVVPDTTRTTLNDSLQVRKGGKIITIESYSKRFQPRKALMYSAVLPGMGQVYNKKYWKVPIVFGGFYFLTDIAIKYNDLLNKYKSELFGYLETPSIPPASGYTETQLRTVIDTYRRQRDYFIILDMFMYILQLVDAHVDAHLKEFDLNPQLKVGLKPSLQYNMTGFASGISLTFTF